MKILMLLFKDIHFDARVKREALALAEVGHKVIIACLEEFEDEPSELHENIKLIRCQISTKRIKRNVIKQQKKSSTKSLVFRIIRLPIIKLLKDIMANREFLQTIKQEMKRLNFKPDVIHCHDLNTLPVGCLLNNNLPSKLVYDSHELFNEMASKNKLEKKIGYVIEKFLIKKVDHLITVNPFVHKEFRKRYGHIPTTIIQNIPITYDNGDVEQDNYLRRKYDLTENNRILLYQGGINPERGLEKCIDAIPLLGDEYKLILLGSGRIVGELKNKVKALHLEKRVFFHDQVPSEKLAWYTKQADIGLVLYENTCLNNYLSTPNKIFEYLQAGLPTVASNHPGKNYIINEYRTGVTVEETPNGIRDGILEIEKRYLEIKNNCMIARKKLTWQQENVKLTELYKVLGELS